MGAFAPALVPGRASRPKSASGRYKRAQEQRAVTRRGTYRCNQPRGVDAGFLSCAPTVPSRPTECEINLPARAWPYAVLTLNSKNIESSTSSKPTLRSVREVLASDLHSDRNIGEPQARR